MPEPFDDGKGVSEGLTAAGPVSADEVASCVNDFVSLILDGEEEVDVFLSQDLGHVGVFDEEADVFFGETGLFGLGLLHEGVGRDDVSGHHWREISI